MKRSKIIYVMAFVSFLFLINALKSKESSFSKEPYHIILANSEKDIKKNKDSLNKKDKSLDKKDRILSLGKRSLPVPPPDAGSKIYAADIDFYIPVLFIVAVAIIVFYSKNKNISNRK
jgi:hypothetical protein